MVCTYFLVFSFLFIPTAPNTIPPTSKVARIPKTVPPTNPPMAAAATDGSFVGSGWVNDNFSIATNWSRYMVSSD